MIEAEPKFTVQIMRTLQGGAVSYSTPPQCMDDSGWPLLYDTEEEAQRIADELTRKAPIHLGAGETGGYVTCPVAKGC
jgi:hypothetical protein